MGSGDWLALSPASWEFHCTWRALGYHSSCSGDKTSGRRKSARCYLTIVAFALDLATLQPREEFFDVGLGHFLQVKVEFGGDLRHVPEHVAEFIFQGLAILFGNSTGLISKDLLHFPDQLPGFVHQPQRGVDNRVIGLDQVPGLA